MNYLSTRGKIKENNAVSSMFAIKTGLAEDGGLFVPQSMPSLTSDDIESLAKMDYPHRAADVLSRFLTDYDKNFLLESAQKAYAADNFVGGAAPVAKLDENRYILELWHGPTCAFKDMALQIMPRLLSGALKGTDEKRCALILVATSGDTGKAALEGYKDVEGVKITVFYPEDGVSRVQKLQMAIQTGENVDVCSIIGNFDDAQNGVKKIFSDTEFAEYLDKNGYFLSSANSINWGRLAPQIVYYISAYCDMLNSGVIKNGEEINVTVPTGNFGNILAAYFAKLMGLPINKLVCASNCNNVLTDFINTGKYNRNRKFFTTMSPSMDILISSNLERLLYLLTSSDETAEYMRKLNETGEYQVSENCLAEIKKHFVGFYSDEDATAATIKETFEEHNYLLDTHTAVAVKCAGDFEKTNTDGHKMLIVSTASPYKFAADVLKSICDKSAENDLAALEMLSKETKTQIPGPLDGIDKRPVRFDHVINKDDMKQTVAKSLGL